MKKKKPRARSKSLTKDFVPSDGGDSPFIKKGSKKVSFRKEDSISIINVVSQKKIQSRSMADSSFLGHDSFEEEDGDQQAILESAKDKLRLATIERKRMTSINAVGDRRFGGKTIDEGRP